MMDDPFPKWFQKYLSIQIRFVIFISKFWPFNKEFKSNLMTLNLELPDAFGVSIVFRVTGCIW